MWIWQHRCNVAPTGAQSGGDAGPWYYEIFSGADVTSCSGFGYTGTVWAFGRNVTEEGPRIKVQTGAGFYDYETTLRGVSGRTTVEGDVHIAEILAGYLWRRGAWTFKTCAGVAYEAHELSPNEPANSVNGSGFGAKAWVELWRNLGHADFASFDASYSSAFDGYFAQARLGRQIATRLSLGLEGAGLGNEEYDNGRVGGFVRYTAGNMEFTVSGGISDDCYSDDVSGYATLGLFSRF